MTRNSICFDGGIFEGGSRSMAFASEMASARWLRVKLESGDDRYREKTYGRSR
jgi:hypothetical protein